MNKNESKYYNTSLLMDEALILLLEDKDFQFISVKEICKKAGVSRSTFYLHYETMDDLLNETIERLSKKFYSSFHNQDKNMEEMVKSAPLNELVFLKPDYIKPYISFVYENKKIFALSLKKPLIFNVTNYFEKMYRSYFEPIMSRFNVEKKLQRYIVTYYCHGIISIINRWLADGCKESIDELVEIISYCLGMNVKNAYERKD